PEVLLHGHGIVGAALDGGVVGHDDAFAAGDSADAGDDPGSRAGIVVHAVRGQRGEFEERSARIEEVLDALARQQLAPVDMTLPGLLGPAWAVARMRSRSSAMSSAWASALTCPVAGLTAVPTALIPSSFQLILLN